MNNHCEQVYSPLYDTLFCEGVKGQSIPFFAMPLGTKDKGRQLTNSLRANQLLSVHAFLVTGIRFQYDKAFSGSLEMQIGSKVYFDLPVRSFKNDYVHLIAPNLLIVPDMFFGVTVRPSANFKRQCLYVELQGQLTRPVC